MKKLIAALSMTSVLLIATAVHAEGEHVAPIKAYIAESLKAAMTETVVVEAIVGQNTAHANLNNGDIDKLDKQWRAEVDAGSKPMIDAVTSNALSAYLVGMKEAGQGKITEVFVMDNKGLNVGVSDVTSDYWQGDEGKFKKSFGAGASGVFIDDVEKDDSTQSLQSQASFTIVDPASGKAIGAVTFGINVDEL